MVRGGSVLGRRRLRRRLAGLERGWFAAGAAVVVCVAWCSGGCVKTGGCWCRIDFPFREDCAGLVDRSVEAFDVEGADDAVGAVVFVLGDSCESRLSQVTTIFTEPRVSGALEVCIGLAVMGHSTGSKTGCAGPRISSPMAAWILCLTRWLVLRMPSGRVSIEVALAISSSMSSSSLASRSSRAHMRSAKVAVSSWGHGPWSSRYFSSLVGSDVGSSSNSKTFLHHVPMIGVSLSVTRYPRAR